MKTFKKCLAFLLALFLIAGNLPLKLVPGSGVGSGGVFELRAKAYSVENGYEYYLLADNTVRIFSLTQYFSGTVNIPATLGGKTVSEIGQSVFENKKDITGVTIPAGVKLIDDNAFRGCDGLLSVSFPATLATIGSNVFMDCIHLTSVSIPNSVTSIGSAVFFNCTALQTASVGTGISTLPSIAFSQCTSLVSVTLQPNLQIIGYGAFMDDSSLVNIAIPSSVTEIQQYAFRGCTKLANFTFNPPASIQKMGEGAFYACHALTQITLPGSLTDFDDSVFYNCINLTSVTFPYGTAAIPKNMFNSCGKLSYVFLPNTVTSIGENAFIWCTSLPSINLPGGLKTIGNSAFYHCASLTSISLPEGMETMDYQAFAASGLQFVSLPSTLTALPNKAFYECYDLLSVTMPDSVVNFGTDVFKSCNDLTIYCNPDSVAEQYAVTKSIPYIHIVSVTVQFNANGGSPGMIFTQNCGTALTAPAVTRTGYTLTSWQPAVPAVTPAANTTYTAQWTINKYNVEYRYGGTVTTYSLNYGDNMIPPLIFFQPDDLTVFTGWSPEVPATVPAQDTTYTAQYTPVYTYTVSSGEVTITDCSTLVTGSLEIPAELDGYPVKVIGYNAFKDCTGITGITIPSSVTAIDVRSFDGCTGLTSITIPSSVSSIGSGAFQNCTALASINLPDSLQSIGTAAFLNTAWYDSKPNGLVYAGKYVYKYKGTMPASTNIAINAGTLGIADYAFSTFSNLTSITIPEPLTFIGNRSFAGCSGLPAFIIPENVVSIGSQAFLNCTALTLGCFAESYGHTYANTNDIPHALVAKITFDANGGNGGGSFVMYSGTAMSAPSVTRSSFVFNGWSPELPALVPEVNTTYTAQWVTLLSYTITNQVVTITGLNTSLNGLLTIPDTIENFPVKHIAAAALMNKTGLTGVDFPAGLLTIGEQAFRGCTGLTSITLPSKLTAIEGAAFNGCTNLTSIIIPESVRNIGTEAFAGCTGLTLYVYPRSRAMLYAANNHLNYRVFVTVSFSLNGGTGTVPAPQSGLDGDEVTMPPQSDIARTGYHFLGWSLSPTATEAFANFTMAPDNVTLYAVWSRIPTISPFSGAATVINTQSGYIYGLATGITQAEFESAYIALTGNGRLEYTLPSGGFGTGTQVRVIDNITDEVINTYTIIIFGDLNGDGSIDSIDAGKAVDFENYMVPWDPADDALYIKAGDLNGDGSLDSIDAGIIVDAENYIITVNQVTGQLI